jgi:hypothetical protein
VRSRRLDRLVFSQYDPDLGEAAAFEQLVSSRATLSRRTLDMTHTV